MSVLILAICGLGWVFIISSMKEDSLYFNIQKATAFLSPPISAVFVAAIFWTKATEPVSFHRLKPNNK